MGFFCDIIGLKISHTNFPHFLQSNLQSVIMVFALISAECPPQFFYISFCLNFVFDRDLLLRKFCEQTLFLPCNRKKLLFNCKGISMIESQDVCWAVMMIRALRVRRAGVSYYYRVLKGGGCSFSYIVFCTQNYLAKENFPSGAGAYLYQPPLLYGSVQIEIITLYLFQVIIIFLCHLKASVNQNSKVIHQKKSICYTY